MDDNFSFLDDSEADYEKNKEDFSSDEIDIDDVDDNDEGKLLDKDDFG